MGIKTKNDLEADLFVRMMTEVMGDEVTFIDCTPKSEIDVTPKSERRGLHVIPTNGKWGVRKSGSARASGVYDTQEEAIEQGEKIAENQKAILYIHGRDGRIRKRITCG